MRLTAGRRATTDYEPDVLRARRVHFLVKSHCFSFAIGKGCRLDFGWGFPFAVKAVGNTTQILDPVIDQSQGEIFLMRATLGKENGLDAAHLPIVRSGVYVKEDRIGEARDGREPDQSDNESEDFGWADGLQAYSNHRNYDLYKQRACHPVAAPKNLRS